MRRIEDIFDSVTSLIGGVKRFLVKCFGIKGCMAVTEDSRGVHDAWGGVLSKFARRIFESFCLQSFGRFVPHGGVAQVGEVA
jgi:hypothetical protein